MLHCGSANRVGAVWMVYRVLDEGVTWEQAHREALEVGLRTDGYVERAKEYVEARSNKRFERGGTAFGRSPFRSTDQG